jgi:superoxide dismutase, Cu-Zn family
VRSRKLLVIGGVICLAVSIPMAHAASAHAKIANAQGKEIGSAKITSTADGVKISVKVSDLTAGEHGIHIHNVGKCEGPAFTTAGGHFNPTSAHHGTKNTQDPHPHLGDLQNLVVSDKGKGDATFMVTGATLGDGPNSLFHDGGTSLVIHAKADDYTSDPSGNSGDRIACGVIEK